MTKSGKTGWRQWHDFATTALMSGLRGSPKLLSGESACEWESWFKAHHDGNSWARMPSGFDVTQWLMNHTALLNQSREGILRADGGPEPLQPQGDFSSAGR